MGILFEQDFYFNSLVSLKYIKLVTMVNSGMKVPEDVMTAGNLCLGNKVHAAVIIDLDPKSNTLSINKTFPVGTKHPYRACLKHFENDKASFALLTAKVEMTAAAGSRALRFKFSQCNHYIEIQEKSPYKNSNDILSKVVKSNEGCATLEGVAVTQNEQREWIFSDGKNHDDSDEE